MTAPYTCDACGNFVRPEQAEVVEHVIGMSGPGFTRWAHPECVEAARRQLAEIQEPLLYGLLLPLPIPPMPEAAQEAPPPLPRRIRQCDIDPARLRTRTLYLAPPGILRVGTVPQRIRRMYDGDG